MKRGPDKQELDLSLCGKEAKETRVGVKVGRELGERSDSLSALHFVSVPCQQTVGGHPSLPTGMLTLFLLTSMNNAECL